MPQNFKERWGIPIIQNVVGGVIVGIPFMVWAAWYSGVKLHSIFSLAWFKAVFTAPVQVWLVFILLAVGGFIFALYRRSLITLREEQSRIERLIDEADTNRAVTLPNPPTAPNSAPSLHASWLGSSDWGWASPNFVDEGMRVYLIRGEVTLLLTNSTERVHIVGAEIQGAKSMGDFEPFDLHPDHPRKHELRLYFRGPAPKGTDTYAPQITFVDIKRNRYPTEPHEFHPFPVVDRVNVELHGRL